MESITELGNWISENEALLSGLAALIVVAGVIFSPIGIGVRRVLGQSADARERSDADPDVSGGPRAEPSSLAGAGANFPPIPEAHPSIAVLPLVNMSDDREQEHLADGLTEDLITALAATNHRYVASRNSAFAYKGQSPDIRDVGRALGVRYVVEGSVRLVGERIRTTIQLIEAESGGHLWANRYDHPRTDMLDLQDSMVGEIAGTLSMEITAAEVDRNRDVPASELGAWQLVQRGMGFNFNENPSIERSRKVVELTRRAVELESNDAFASAAHAWQLLSSAINGWAEDEMGTFREGQAQLRATIDIGSWDALTQYYIGAAYIYMGRHDVAVRFLKQSLASNPYQPDAMVHLALAWAYLEDFDRAREGFDAADRISSQRSVSTAYSWYRGIALGLEDRYAEAIPIISAVLEHTPRYATARVTLASAYEMTGQPEKAKAAVEKAHGLDPGLNMKGILMNVSAHPDPEKGRARGDVLRRYWPD